MKTLIYKQKINTGEKLVLRIYNAAKIIRNNHDAIHRTEEILKWAECCVNSKQGQFEQFM